jgi:hypothetical protein
MSLCWQILDYEATHYPHLSRNGLGIPIAAFTLQDGKDFTHECADPIFCSPIEVEH